MNVALIGRWVSLGAAPVLTFLLCSFAYYKCGQAPVSADEPGITFGPTVPTDIANPADPQQAAVFAWQEFVAVTWPAKKNPNPGPGLSAYFRGQPSPTDVSGSTGAGGVTVWETFYHRNELYPSYASGTGNQLPDPNAIPNYNYGTGVTITKATPMTDVTLFNNLDETTEIGLANMYFTPVAQKADSLKASGAPAQQIADASLQAALVYQAKGNGVIFNYLKSNGLNNAVPRRKAKQAAVNVIMNMPPGPDAPFSLPNGSLEIKSTFRFYNPQTDNLDDFHWTTGIYYTGTAPNLVANNAKLLLVGLHIIQKTPNVQTFTFATFEHVSNEKNGFRFTNTNPQTYTPPKVKPPAQPRALPDPGVIEAKRQYPIPDYVAKLNTQVQAQLRSTYGKSNVWANYQLIGIQAVVQNDPDPKIVPPQQFFLSNFATETDDSLQFFQGGLAGTFSNVPNPDLAHVFKLNPATNKYVAYTSGGCLGCHGSQGQFAGGDFSVIAATGNTFIPDVIHPYPAGQPVVPQNPQGFPLPHVTN
jgi:hypothetical protein